MIVTYVAVFLPLRTPKRHSFEGIWLTCAHRHASRAISFKLGQITTTVAFRRQSTFAIIPSGDHARRFRQQIREARDFESSGAGGPSLPNGHSVTCQGNWSRRLVGNGKSRRLDSAYTTEPT